MPNHDMEHVRLEDDSLGGSVTVLGPCPGCLSWQVDYSDAVCLSFCHAYWDTRPFERVVESVLQEHLAECSHLQRLLGERLS